MDKPYIDEELAASQQQMVEIFANCTSSDELMNEIEKSDIQSELKVWLQGCQPDMLETAASLVKKWGSTSPDDGVGL
ncbi:MAG: hypothetical protein QNL01_14800 [Akkermansiaceae bacterium]|jgi:hypothetical protein|nr:hypothetical protein [Akkermansiaceae bacterium]|tara:strand:- start:12589 stop:12819 length:231 start_codon:yes stop_codon:yes gene_type:complete